MSTLSWSVANSSGNDVQQRREPYIKDDRRGHSSVVERSSGEREDHGSNPGLGNRYVRPEAALLFKQ